MKSIILSVLLLQCSINICAQTFPVTTISETGDQSKRINLAFLSEGYTAGELTGFLNHVKKFQTQLFNEVPFNHYRNFFNLYAIEVPSIESGADHPGTATDEPMGSNHPVRTANTYFGATFDCGNIHRLLCLSNGFAVNQVLMNNLPNYDQSFIFVNTPFYGGAGGTHPTASLHNSSGEIAIHEIGHSFAGLMDEYFIATQPEAPNRTKNNNPQTIAWKNWLGTDNVGIYPYGTSNQVTWYRPHQNCKMQYLGTSFCPVCVEAFINRIYNLVTPIDAATPAFADVAITDSTRFSVALVKPEPYTLSVEWQLNDLPIATDTNALTIQRSQLKAGTNELNCFVTDETLLSRTYRPLSGYVFTQSWFLKASPSSSNTTPTQTGKFFYQISPNPTPGPLSLAGSSEHPIALKVAVFNALGQQITTKDLGLVQGEYQTALDLDGHPDGLYTLVLTLGKGYVIERKIVKTQ